jgi:hypothetical protein
MVVDRAARARTLGVLAGLIAASVAGAATFDLHLRPYCKPGTFCGHASATAHQAFMCEAVQEMNLIWEPTGFSFRPTLFPIDSTSPSNASGLPAGKTKYYQVEGCAGGDDDDVVRKHWKDNVAEKNTAAITMMLTPNWNTCCSGIPRTIKKLDEHYGMFCDALPNRGVFGLGSLWAHEMGHHWSLAHTHGTCADTADGEDPTADADAWLLKACSTFKTPDGAVELCGNDAQCAALGLGTCVADQMPLVEDTPADRCGFEACGRRCQGDTTVKCTTNAGCPAGKGPCICTKSGLDENFAGDLLDGHTWIATNGQERDMTPVTTGIDTGSPHPTWCPAEVKERAGGVTSAQNTNPPQEVTVRNVMSYHPAACGGPYVRNGVRREAFTADQLALVAACRSQIYPRDPAHLPDVCAAGGGDADHDGICGQDDNCPAHRNTCQTNADGDPEGDACDLCPQDPTPTGDLDDDGIGDVCDEDRDGDGCLNAEDDHPDAGEIANGVKLFVGCGIDTEPIYVSEGLDPDTDGLPSCMDPDDDNDGFCDAPAPSCTQVGDACPETPGQVCLVPGGGEPCPPIWLACLGTGCEEFFLKLSQLVNPDPTTDVILDRLAMAGRSIFAAAPAGLTASEAAGSIASLVGNGPVALARAAVPFGQLRAELWRRDPAGDRLVALVGEFDAADVRLGTLGRGALIRLTPSSGRVGGDTLDLETTWAIGTRTDEARDRDGDGTPDVRDDCVTAADPDQVDADADGFGNACDADLDGDGTVADPDVARVRACEGANLTAVLPILEPPSYEGEPLGVGLGPELDPLDVALADACRSADLDGDRVVDGKDTERAVGLLGTAPGPSAVTRGGGQSGPPPAPPACARGAVIDEAKVAFTRKRFKLKGELALPFPFEPPLDPATTGLELTVRDATGRAILEATIPGGAHDRRTRAGWRPMRGGAEYANRDGLAGIHVVRLVWKDRKAPGTVRVVASGRAAGLALGDPPALPLVWQLSLDPVAPATRQCGETEFQVWPTAPGCGVKKSGTVLCGAGRRRLR